MLKGKKGVIFGIANDHSIAWGVAQKLKENGAILGITYQNDTLLKRVRPLSEKLDSEFLIKCDFSKDFEPETVLREFRYQLNPKLKNYDREKEYREKYSQDF